MSGTTAREILKAWIIRLDLTILEFDDDGHVLASRAHSTALDWIVSGICKYRVA